MSAMWINLTTMTDQMIRDEIAKGPHPKRSKLAIAGAAVAVVVVAGGAFFGIRAINEVQADIAADKAAALEYYEAAEEQARIAQEAADEAAQSVTAANEAATAAEAAEAAAEAQAAADAAAAAAAAAENPGGNGGGGYAYGSYPAGAVPPNLSGTDAPDSSACASSSLVWDGSKSVCA